jgi:hypothetical protein
MARQLTREERLARNAQRREEAEQALKELARMQDAFKANYERLKADRLARSKTGLTAKPLR